MHKAALARLARHVQLRQHPERSPDRIPLRGERLRQAEAVDRVDEGEPARPACLVALEVTDQVPFDRHMHLVHLVQRFLHPVLPHRIQSRIPGRDHCIGTIGLGDRHDADVLPMPPSRHRGRDALTDLLHARRQPLKWHNAISYQ